MPKKPFYKFDVSLVEETKLRKFKAVVGYESVMRGLTLGQTVAQMVEEAADVDGYPDEVKARLAQIEEASAVRAVGAACSAVEVAQGS